MPPNHTIFSQRMPTDLHDQATAVAKQRGQSLTAFVNDAVAELVTRTVSFRPPSPTDATVHYETSVHFALPDDNGSDHRALLVGQQATAAAQLAGAVGPIARTLRIVALS